LEITIIILVLFIALEHLGFLYLEMFMWTKPAGIKIFGNTKEKAELTKVLAANQGLYNGFISAGLVWGTLHPNLETGYQIIVFFLLCVIVAGIYGSITANKSILYIQAIPAFIALILTLVNMLW
jgi:putative membrane protein